MRRLSSRSMSKKDLIRVFEYERLRIGERGFEQRHWEAIARWAERQEEKYLEVWAGSVRFLQWVGVIEIEGLVIEILPKAETKRDVSDADAAAAKWQRILLSLLKVAGYMDVRAVDAASLRFQGSTLLDILFSQYLDSLEQLLRAGLVKRYRPVLKDRNSIKGRIDHAANVRNNLVHAERISTMAYEYDRINRLNLILKAATEASALFAPTGYARSRARNLGLYFADWPDKVISSADFIAIRINRKTEGYRRPIGLAKLILEKRNPDFTGGHERVFSLLFDMNDLWEKALFARLRRESATKSGLSVSAQKSKVFWRSDTGLKKKVRPDIVLERDGGSRTILDTKWKALYTTIPSDQDLKQVFTYDALWDALDGFLIYPRVSAIGTSVGIYEKEINGSRRRCGVVFAEVDPEHWADESLLAAIGC